MTLFGSHYSNRKTNRNAYTWEREREREGGRGLREGNMYLHVYNI